MTGATARCPPRAGLVGPAARVTSTHTSTFLDHSSSVIGVNTHLVVGERYGVVWYGTSAPGAQIVPCSKRRKPRDMGQLGVLMGG